MPAFNSQQNFLNNANINPKASGPIGPIAASDVSFTPYGFVSATDVQNAIQQIVDSITGAGTPSGPNHAIQIARDGLFFGTGRFEYDYDTSTFILGSPDNTQYTSFFTSNDNGLTLGYSGGNYLSLTPSLITLQPNTLQWQGDSGDSSAYFQLTAQGNDAVFLLNGSASLSVHGGTIEADSNTVPGSVILNPDNSLIQIINGSYQAEMRLDQYGLNLTDQSNVLRLLVSNLLVTLVGDGVDPTSLSLSNFDNSSNFTISNPGSTSNSTGNFQGAGGGYIFDGIVSSTNVNTVALDGAKAALRFSQGIGTAHIQLASGVLNLSDSNDVERLAIYNGGVSVIADGSTASQFNLYNFDNTSAVTFFNNSISTGVSNLNISGAATYTIADGQFIAQAAQFNGNVQIQNGSSFVVYNADNSGQFHISNPAGSFASECDINGASLYRLDNPLYVPSIYDSTYGLAFDVVNRQFFAYDGTLIMELDGGVAPGLNVFESLYFPNRDQSASAVMFCPGATGDAHLLFEADYFEFNNYLNAPAIHENSSNSLVIDLVARILKDSAGNSQLSWDPTGVGFPQLTPSSLLGLDAGNYAVSVPTSTFASAAQGALADTALQPGDTTADIIPIVIAGTALNGSYFLTQVAKYAGTITAFSAAASSLTTAGTYTIAINGTPVTGLNGVANTTASTETNATAANTFSIGDVITITFAATLALVNFQGQLSLTRGL